MARLHALCNESKEADGVMPLLRVAIISNNGPTAINTARLGLVMIPPPQSEHVTLILCTGHLSDTEVNTLLPAYSTGYVLLPEDEDSVQTYCMNYCLQMHPRMHIRVFETTPSSIASLLEEAIEHTDHVIVSYDCSRDPGDQKAVEMALENDLVTPSVYFLNGEQIKVVNRKKIMKFYKRIGQLTRSNWHEGVLQWGHLMNEMAFCLALAPKYGD